MTYFSWRGIALGLISYVRIFRLKFAKSIKKFFREIPLRKFSQHNTPSGSGLADCRQTKPIILNHITWCEPKTRAKMVVDIISRAKYPLPTKPEISAPRLLHRNRLNKNWPNKNSIQKSQKSSSSSKTRGTKQVAPERAKEIMLAKIVEMREAGYVINICNEWRVFFAFFISANVSGKLIAWHTMFLYLSVNIFIKILAEPRGRK